METELSVSIVTYKNDIGQLNKLLDSLTDTRVKLKIFVIDNSPTDTIREACSRREVTYIFNNKNIGYGAANNIAIRKTIDMSKYHLVMNPDISFDRGTLEKIYEFMESDHDIGLLMPKILSYDGSIQYLCKLLPTPWIFFMRRFAFKIPVLKPLLRNMNNIFELRFTGYDKIINAPCLSGCFMFIRNEALKKVGMFDERYFMYLEDFDLSRRIHRYYRTLYYPQSAIYHKLGKGAYKSLKLLMYFIVSTVRYFNKWGWVFDKERKPVNNKVLRNLKM